MIYEPLQTIITFVYSIETLSAPLIHSTRSPHHLLAPSGESSPDQ